MEFTNEERKRLNQRIHGENRTAFSTKWQGDYIDELSLVIGYGTGFNLTPTCYCILRRVDRDSGFGVLEIAENPNLSMKKYYSKDAESKIGTTIKEELGIIWNAFFF